LLFRESLNYDEDLIYRHLNPPRAFQIEIGRLGAHYNIRPVADGPILNRHIRAFLATQKNGKGEKEGGSARVNVDSAPAKTRFFVRALVHGRVLENSEDCRSFIRHEVERMLQECCESLALSKGFVEKQTGRAVAYNHFGTLQMCNHLFLAIVPQLHLSRFEAVELLEAMIEKNQSRLRQVGVIEVEIPLNLVEPSETDPVPECSEMDLDERREMSEQFAPIKRDAIQMRVLFCNPSGHKVQTNAYLEVLLSHHDLKLTAGYRYKSFIGDGKAPGPLDGKDVLAPYPPMDQLELKRLMAKGKETTYVYDMITLFDKAVAKAWERYQAKQNNANFISKLWPRRDEVPSENFISREYMLNPAGDALVQVTRPPGQNDVAMVVWRLWLRTPECPSGREIILVANDSTVQNGSFGVKEDQMFLLATQMAQAEGLPRIYIAANSGARIGLVEEVKSKFRVQWNDPLNPLSGMEFLYLDDTEVDVLTQRGMATTETIVASDGTKRRKITAVIGPDGIGVENLQGSGKIAGITSRAYNDIFTLTFVSGTSVGIGAYLVRLGQRTIQKGPPILLTGEAALNKVSACFYLDDLYAAAP
jgi:acetyl-CoA carboxylase/biotin carboxylase 1